MSDSSLKRDLIENTESHNQGIQWEILISFLFFSFFLFFSWRCSHLTVKLEGCLSNFSVFVQRTLNSLHPRV